MNEEMRVTAAEIDWVSPGEHVRINDTYYRVTRMVDRRTAVMVLAPWYVRALLYLRNAFRSVSAVFTRRRW